MSWVASSKKRMIFAFASSTLALIRTVLFQKPPANSSQAATSFASATQSAMAVLISILFARMTTTAFVFSASQGLTSLLHVPT